MSKKIIFISIVLLWAILLGLFITYKEFTLRTGEKILLKTVPVDPRDLFRGDYVILRYEISNLELGDFGKDDLEVEEGDTVYVELREESGYWVSNNIHKENPNKLALKGRVKDKREDDLNIEYGIESFFVPEGEGKELEKYRESKKLDVEVTVDKFGNGIINNLYIEGEVWIAP